MCVHMSCVVHVRLHVNVQVLFSFIVRILGVIFAPSHTHGSLAGMRDARHALAASFPFTPRTCIRAGFAQAKFIWKEVLQSPMDESPRDGFFAQPWKHFDLPSQL